MPASQCRAAHFAASPLGLSAFDFLALFLATAELLACLNAIAARSRVTNLLAQVLFARHESIASFLA